MTRIQTKTATALVLGASTLALAGPAQATETFFSSNQLSVSEGDRMNQVAGVTQVRLNNGATASFIDAADFRVNADGSVDLYAGGVTVTAGSDGSETIVRMPESVEGRVGGAGSAASFNVGSEGEARGHALSGSVRIGRGGNLRSFDSGEMFAIPRGGSVRRVVSNGAQSTPFENQSETGPVVAMGEGAGPVAAAQNGLPIALGDALAATGASGDILGAARRVEAAVANPLVNTFPSGDLALLVAGAADLEGAFGGTPFTGAQADIIRTYLGFLAGGGSGADFLTAYSGFLVQYFDLIRSGGVPSQFALANLADANAFTAFLARTQGFAALSAQDRALADAYLAFIGNGGNADLFAGTFTDLTEAYFAFLRAGGNPQDFADASLAMVESYIAFLDNSGLSAQLSTSDRALLSAYLANGGVGFVAQYRAALEDFSAFLASGRPPSEYDGADIAVLLGYVQTLQSAGLLGAALGDNAGFFADFATFVQGGGQIDAFGQLNANIFAGYAQALNAYFAFLDAGGVPSAYGAAEVDVLNDYLAQLAAAGAIDRFLGDRSAFFADYLAFLQGGGALDTYARLNANVFGGYARALGAYYAYLEQGGVPSAYTALDQATIRAYLAALARGGASDRFLADLAAFYADYFAFVQGGGNPDNFAGLPVPPDFPAFASALNAYAAFLQGGGLPADYDAVDLALLQKYLEAIVASGQLADLLGTQADLLTSYFTYLATGGPANGFSGLPVYADYVTALNAYYAFLANGGLPADYTALTQAQVQAYLAALNGAGGFAAYDSLNAFFVDYFAFVAGGGDPAAFVGIPVYADYVAALNAYFAFLESGGVPSEYAILTQAQIEAYLAALANAQDGFASFGALNAFFVEYFAFLDQGGDPDQFAGLPGGGNNGGGTSEPSPQLGSVRGWQFASDGLRIARVDADVTADGRITEMTVYNPSGVTTDYSNRTADLREFGHFGDAVAWTRYYVGSANRQQNGSEHLMVGTPAFDLPTSGLVEYALVGGTAPTNRDAAPGSTGWFTGDLAVAFGSAAPRVGFNFDLYTEGTGYRVQTSGGATGAATGGLGVSAEGVFESQSLSLEVIAGTGCTGYCIGQVFGGLFGESASHAGFTYNVFDRNQNNAVRGVAIFGREGDAIAGLGDPDQDRGTGQGGGTPTPVEPFAGTVTGLEVLQTRFGLPSSTLENYGNSTVTFDADGNIDTYTNNRGSTAGSGLALADADDEAGNTGSVAWARFIDSNNNQGQVEDTGAHVIVGTPTVDLPTTGLVSYALIGGTRPTTNEGTLPAGSFSGDLAIDFAAMKVGVDFDIYIAEYGWNIATAGGATDPSTGGMDIRAIGQHFFKNSFALTPLTDASCLGSCTGDILGNLYGSGASHAGVVYRVTDGGIQARGSAVFAGPEAAGDPVDMIGTRPAAGGGGTNNGTGNPVGTAVFSDALIAEARLNSSSDRGTHPRNPSDPTGANANIGYETNADGDIVGLVVNGSFGGADRIGTARNADTGRTDSGSVRWTRWTEGAVDTSRNAGPASPVSLSANQGYHILVGTPATDLPTAGRVDYDLVGGTSPTHEYGSAGPGTLVSGGAAVEFGTAPKVGIALVFDYDSDRFTAQTAGGLGDLSQSELTLVDGAFYAVGSFGNVTSRDGTCTTGCRAIWDGFLAGDGGREMGVNYIVQLNSSVNEVIGSAAFVAADAMGAGASAAPSAVALGSLSAPITSTGGATPPPPIPTIEANWARWTSATGVSAVLELPESALIDPADRTVGAGSPAKPLGDWITFGLTEKR